MECDKHLKISMRGTFNPLTEFQRYFPEFKEKEAALARNPFPTSLDVSDIPDELQNQFLVFPD